MSTDLLERAPWATTLAGIARRHAAAELVLEAAGNKLYRIAFEGGSIVGASSPLPNDSAVRIATVNNFVPRGLAPELAKRITPGCDEIALLAETANLTLEQTAALWRIIITQRAARTFSVDAGRFDILDDISIRRLPGTSVDVGVVIYQGARLNLAEERLAAHLRGVGTYFVMRPDANLARFAFEDDVQPVIDALTHGASLPELDAKHRDIDPRTLRALVSTLVACEQCEAFFEAAIAPPAMPVEAPVATFKQLDGGAYSDRGAGRDVVADPISYRVKTPSTPPLGTPTEPVAGRTPTGETAVARTPTNPAVTRTPTSPAVTRTPTNPAVTRTPTNPALTHTPTGPAIARTPTPSEWPRPQPSVARAPTGPREGRPIGPATGRTPTPARTAAATGQPATRRAPTSPSVARTSTDDAKAGAEAFQRGLKALHAERMHEAIFELEDAHELAPQMIDYLTYLAWARFCAAADKAEILAKTREAFLYAIQHAPSPILGWFYLGRAERMLGHDRDALRHFQEVLNLDPKHAAAAAEVRMLEARLNR